MRRDFNYEGRRIVVAFVSGCAGSGVEMPGLAEV